MELTIEACQPVDGKTILEIGCGASQCSFPLAELGAAKVVGIDVAAPVIDQANVVAKQKSIESKCIFKCADVENFETDETFDYVIGMGIFDHIKEDRIILKKLRMLTKSKVVLTFPKAATWRAPLRKIMGTPFDTFDEKRIGDHLMIAGFVVRNLTIVGNHYFVEAS